MKILRVATRRSPLARRQTSWVTERLAKAHPGLSIELVEISSSGDKDRHTPLTALPEIGAFTKALQEALHDKKADCAVHSLKDLPVQEPAGLIIAAIPTREDPRDALVSAHQEKLADLPEKAVVGTGSPRRAQQLLEFRPDLIIREIRGNVGTRLQKTYGGTYDATVLALAGLRRLGQEAVVSEILQILPAPGQGALALECRADDTRTRSLLSCLHNPHTANLVTAERSWLGATGAGCRTSAAAWAVLQKGTHHQPDHEPERGPHETLQLRWFFNGKRGEIIGPCADAAALGRRACEHTF